MAKREVTPKQKEIAALVVKGKSNKQIAEELGMSEGTLRAHQQHIRQTTGIKNTKEAARAVVQNTYGAAGQQSGGCSSCGQPGGRHLPNCNR